VKYIHINSHFSIGVIAASIFHYYFQFNLIEFVSIVICAFICDFDVFFSKFAKDRNHRNLISHSIIPSILLIVLGLIFYSTVLLLCGFVYFIHIFIDTFDWGTNFFYFPKKTFGLRLLMSKEEENDLSKYLTHYKYPESFFDFKYYSNKVCITIEAVLFIFMLIFTILFAIEYILIIIFYFFGLCFHLLRHYHLKRIEKK